MPLLTSTLLTAGLKAAAPSLMGAAVPAVMGAVIGGGGGGGRGGGGGGGAFEQGLELE